MRNDLMNRKLLHEKMTGILAVLLVLFMAAGVAEEERTDASGQWKYILKDGSATITGYVEEPSGDLVIPGDIDGYTVTGIGSNAFYELNRLTDVTIPDNVASIGRNAFARCASLTSITIPDSVTHIGERAFAGCAALTSITIPDGVMQISAFAFANTGLTRIDVAAGNPAFESVDGVLFDKRDKALVAFPPGLQGTEGYDIPEGTLRIGRAAFFRVAGLTSISIPDSVSAIEMEAFASCTNLTSVTIPKGVTAIEQNTFIGCSALIDVTFRGRVSIIKDTAFRSCISLANMTLPDSLTYIDSLAFADCTALTSVSLPAGLRSINRRAFEGCGNIVLYVVRGSHAEDSAKSAKIPYEYEPLTFFYVLADGGATITGYSQELLGDLVIPGELDGYPVTSIGDSAFADCMEIANVTIPESVTKIEGEAFARSGVTSVNIPDSVIIIDEWAFKECFRLTNVTIGSNVTSIGGYAFFECKSLAKATIPVSVTNIGASAFAKCKKLKLTVTKGSYAAQYAKGNKIPYVFATK
jgi:hypothetical protein